MNRELEILDETATDEAMSIFDEFEDWLHKSRTAVGRALDKTFKAGQMLRDKEWQAIRNEAIESCIEAIKELEIKQHLYEPFRKGIQSGCNDAIKAIEELKEK